ncbi:MAG: glycosyltransferase family 87 protein [Candidatus Omnitrophota bacterium]|nr:glycosyltransferase family 87 protein [Candidatus Omnitrophota bacterium]MDZ4242346.1 glycosyltransferase family 87 protein [Candidatus Omnitrophota bacterium]
MQTFFMQIDLHGLIGLFVLGLVLQMRKAGGPGVEKAGRFVLILAFVLGLARTVSFMMYCAENVLQMDIACYYTAGESLWHGLSPYKTHLWHNPPVWDGFAEFQHSRFLYPPIIANFFQLLAVWPYAAVKTMWMPVVVLCVTLSLWLSVRYLGLKMTPLRWMGLATFVMLFAPFLMELEVGQVNILTMLFNILAIRAMSRTSPRPYLAGLYFAIAMFIKLQGAFIVPFLLLRGKWATLRGFVAGSLGIFLICFTINGPLTIDYWKNQLPRISWIAGEHGPKELRIPFQDKQLFLWKYRIPQGMTMKQYRVYQLFYDNPINNATLVRPLGTLDWAHRIYQGLGRVGLAKQGTFFLALAFLSVFLIIGLLGRFWIPPRGRTLTPLQDFIYWHAVFVVVLVSGVRTWSANLIWMLPAALILLKLHDEPGTMSPGLRFSFWVTISALVLIGVPDAGFRWMAERGFPLFYQKCVAGELLLFAGLAGILSSLLSRAPSPAFGARHA